MAKNRSQTREGSLVKWKDLRTTVKAPPEISMAEVWLFSLAFSRGLTWLSAFLVSFLFVCCASSKTTYNECSCQLVRTFYVNLCIHT